tara:strand:+ start:1480 stop:1629 length:150 start_codon:yes stop_codon:yes gene_type:complete
MDYNHLVDNTYSALDNVESDWGKNYWATVLVILLRKMKLHDGIEIDEED